MIQTTEKSNFPWQWLALAGIIALYLTMAYLTPPGADTLWRLHVARGLWDGQEIYRDMIETNPPLWFWAGMPAAALGGYPAVVGINLLASLIGLAIFAALGRITYGDKGQWAPILALASGLLLINIGEIGQREQGFLLACVMWCALAAARIEGKSVPIWLALLATCFAAYGFALKHYFVMVPIAIEALIMWHRRRAWTPFRPETFLLAGLAIAYAFAVIFITPGFFGRALGLVQASYFAFGPWNYATPLQRSLLMIVICSFAIIPFIAALFIRTKNVLVHAVLLALAVSVVAVLLQQKGWRYHLIAAYGLSILTMGLLWRSVGAQEVSRLIKLIIPVGYIALVVNGFVQPSLMSLETKGQPMRPTLVNFIAREPRDNYIAILSTAPDNAFYPLARAGRPHWSRHYSIWMMPGLMFKQSDPKREALRQTQYALVIQEFTADLMCRPPDVIVGEAGYFGKPNSVFFDAMGFFSEDRAFAEWLKTHYRRVADEGIYPVWRLSGARPAPKNCSMALSPQPPMTRQ